MIEPIDELDDRPTDFHPRAEPATEGSTSFVVTVMEGPDTGRFLSLDAQAPQRVLVGQSSACELRLVDSEVSRRHAALEVAGTRLRLTDLGSTNGTLVEGVAVVDAYLVGGETVRLGATALRIERGGAKCVGCDAPLKDRFGFLLGASPAMQRLYPLCERLAASNVSIIIEGETGTGKEVLAESIHNASAQASGPFIVFDCTAVPANLMESELFGHEKGAFTGATSQHKGMFEQASGGTILIDEIGDLDATLQPKLLRAVERHDIRRLGAERSTHVDARVIAATRRDLDKEIAAGRFRDDLFHRLAVGRVELPPLRARPEDVVLLAGHFSSELGVDPGRLPVALLARWREAPWPGNVRELRNAVMRWAALGEIDDAPVAREGGRASGTPSDFIEDTLALHLPLTQARQRVIENFEQRYIERVLAAHGGKVGLAAAESGIGRRYFQMLLARYT